MSRFRGFYRFLVFFAIAMLSTGEKNYCRICKDHTMCIYRNTKPICNAKSYGLSREQQNEIVRLHNKYRQKVASGNEKRGNPGPQPPAKHMPDLVWDDELAAIAQKWANQCKYGHDKCRNVKRFPVGQNVAFQWTTEPKPAGLKYLVKLWYEEVTLFDSRQVERVTEFNGVGHYTQMLWAKTKKIGCGFVNYLKKNQNTVYLVCNYGPTGNWARDKMYKIRH